VLLFCSRLSGARPRNFSIHSAANVFEFFVPRSLNPASLDALKRPNRRHPSEAANFLKSSQK
jgi:hypothetical protein